METKTKELLYEIYDFIKEERAYLESREFPCETYDKQVVKRLTLYPIEQFDILFQDRIEETIGLPTPSRKKYGGAQ